VEAVVRQGARRDGDNVVGVSGASANGLDRGDSREPPALPDHVQAYFELAENGTLHRLDRDLRATGADGAVWELVVEAPGGETVSLAFAGLASVPAGHEVVLIPRETFATIDLRERSQLSLPAGRTHHFRLAVGSSAFIESVESGTYDLPTTFALGLGYPNPFRSQTTIRFALPRQSDVSLGVYDVGGRLVRTLVSGARPAGRHEARWTGRDNGGRAVASGVYFYRFRAGDFSETRKILLLK
jgi:hypothetical protein